jgi:phospholipase/carboxylesterase
MRVERIGELTVRITGGIDREGGGTGPLVVLLHGYGAPGTDLVGLWRELRVPREVRFAFPEAPLALDLGMPGFEGRAWWNLDLPELERAFASGRHDAVARSVPEGLLAARRAVEVVLDGLERALGVPAGKTVLGGFSQGAMVSTDLAFGSERPLAGLAVLSGTLTASERWREHMAFRKGLPILQSHGRDDPVLPLVLAHRLRDLMLAEGLGVEYHEFNGGHGISGSVIDALGGFIARAVGATP